MLTGVHLEKVPQIHLFHSDLRNREISRLTLQVNCKIIRLSKVSQGRVYSKLSAKVNKVISNKEACFFLMCQKEECTDKRNG